jgi:hypothetical protein
VDRPLGQVTEAAHRLGDRRVRQVGAHRDHRLDAEDQDQQGRHQRPPAHAGGADQHPHTEAEENDRGIHQE